MVSTRSTTGSAIVSDVTSGTPAAKAGITAGSTLTAIGGTEVSSQAEIAAALAGLNPGDAVKVAWTDSSGTAHTAQVTLAASPVN
jgi:S1-C subfamily serine protease